MAGPITVAGGLALRPDDRERLRSRAGEAIRRARRHGEALAAITIPLPRGADPTSIAAASRRAGEPWFSFEQPERDGFALAAVGCAAAIDERGPQRFVRAAARWRALAEHAACDDPDGPRGSGPVAVGGFAFAPDGGDAPHWAGYEPASLHVPEAAMARRGDGAFVAASPELLVRREGLRAGTLALAGSTRRSADPAVDDHLGEQLLRSDKDREEQLIVTRRIVRALRPHSVWVTAADEPVVVKMANIQHLATPIRAQLAQPVSAVELAGLLHPTPAVGGEPIAAAAPLIPALEGLDRGWYAGPVGWTDRAEDGEFCVALRCALLCGAVARCYAGVGVVRDSDPAAELAETEVKLQALLPVLAG